MENIMCNEPEWIYPVDLDAIVDLLGKIAECQYFLDLITPVRRFEFKRIVTN